MARIRSKSSSLVKDSRGSTGGRAGGGAGFPGLGGAGGMGMPGGVKGGGGLIGLLLIAAVIFLPRLLGGEDAANTTGYVTSQAAGGAGSGTDAGGETRCESEIEQIICGAVNDIDAYWHDELPAAFGRQYESAYTQIYSNQVNTGCGPASAQMGPFYCPAPDDNQVYFDLRFLEQMQRQLGAEGDFAAMYITAHEYGHHVQNVLGINEQVRQLQSRSSTAQRNALSVAMELQADCLAGAWAGDASKRTTDTGLPLLEDGDIEEALNAAGAVGDDRITGGRVSAENFTHGTSAQRIEWFRRGFTDGPTSCDTFTALGLV